MPREIDIGGRQGRGNTKLADMATDFGLLADHDYTEPETKDLGLAPLTHAERALLRIGLALAALAMIALIVSCIN